MGKQKRATSDERPATTVSAGKRATEFRIGIGYDIHRLVEGRPLILGGIQVPHSRGLLGHSDGDVLLHAVADALLGACALGDIGRHFPDTDERFRGADSAMLLGRVLNLVSDKGWRPVNVDVNIIAQEPKFAPLIDEMRGRVASLLSLPLEAVSIKARTNEGLGAIGSGEAIAAQAAVLVGSSG